MSGIDIAGTIFEEGSCRVVAEAGQCMEGSYDAAITMAMAARQAGAWGFKVQLLEPEKIAHENAARYWADNRGSQRDSFTRAGIVDRGAWGAVKEACDDIDIVFFATPFDLEAVDVLEDLDVACYKIASGDITFYPLLDRIAETKKPIILSTGAASPAEIENALDRLQSEQVILLACTLAYPTPDRDAQLKRIEKLAHTRCALRWLSQVGYSDHTTSTTTALAAAALGAVMLEKHFTIFKDSDRVPDHAMALDPLDLYRYVHNAATGALLRGRSGLGCAGIEEPARQRARRSVFAARPMRVGHVIEMEDLMFLRPGDGFPADRFEELLGECAESVYAVGDEVP